jgi:subfamily B ATP-binding cassette protein MsbA
LARAIYKNPAILILDEATSALDNKSERAIQDALEALKEDMITFVVAHRLSTVEGADTIFVFKEGRIVDMGRYDELLESSEEFRKLALSEKGDSHSGDEKAEEEMQ